MKSLALIHHQTECLAAAHVLKLQATGKVLEFLICPAFSQFTGSLLVYRQD